MMHRGIADSVQQMTDKTAASKQKKTAGKRSGERPPIDTKPLDDLLGYHVRLALMELRRSFFRHVAEGNVRPGLASLLQLVAANPGASQVELSRAMHIDKASLVSLLDQAEDAGWLKRVRSKEDRRRHELVLTPAGEATATKLHKQTMRHEKRFVDRFTPAELERVVEYLRRIYE
jgi:DNA-binding MarR family transcriptional regulator